MPPLHRKYRPRSLDEVFGNPVTIKALDAELTKGRETITHAFMMHGEKGCGKTTLARIIAGRLGCHQNDFVEIDAAGSGGVDLAREIKRTVSLMPSSGPCRVWLIDEGHRMSSQCQDELLKTFEEPPNHAYFIICTTEPNKLKPTVRSRFTPFQVNPLPDAMMEQLLRRVVRAERIRGFPDDAYRYITACCQGSPRMALVILDKLVGLKPEDMKEAAERAAAEQNQAIDLARSLMKREKWPKVVKVLKGLMEQEPEEVRRTVLTYSMKVLLNDSPEVTAALVIECFGRPFYDSGKAGLVLACYNVVVG